MDSKAREISQSSYDKLWERNDLEVMKIIRIGRLRRGNLCPKYKGRESSFVMFKRQTSDLKQEIS